MAGNEVGIDEAVRTLRAAYYTTVRAIADETIMAENEAKEAEMTFDRSDYIHEAVDGSEWVIYTQKALIVALVSDTWTAADDAEADFGSDQQSYASTVAYYAMVADVEQTIEALEAVSA